MLGRTCIVVLAGAGCGSAWDLREGATLPTGCNELFNYYLDIDGDGWGVPTKGAPRVQCRPNFETGFTATNPLDCDDLNPDVTGRVGALCPSEIAGPSTSCVDGLVFGDREYAVTCVPVTPQRTTTAQDRCAAWAGSPVGEGAEEPAEGADATRGLADLSAGFERAQVLELWLLPLEEILLDHTMWVDQRWSGTLNDGQWVWGSGAAITDLPWCAGEVAPADFYPELRVEQPEGREALEARLPELRLSLRRRPEGWCRGVPPIEPPYERLTAHYLCERPRPDPAFFAVRPVE